MRLSGTDRLKSILHFKSFVEKNKLEMKKHDLVIIRGGSGMGFFRDPESRDKNPGILGFLSQKNPKSENPKIPGFFGIGIDFFGISPGFLKISNSTSKMIVLYFRSINGIFC